MTQAEKPKTPRELLDEVDKKILEIDKDLALEVFKDVFDPPKKLDELVAFEMRLVKQDPTLQLLWRHFETVMGEHPEWKIAILMPTLNGQNHCYTTGCLLHSYKPPFRTVIQPGMYIDLQRNRLTYAALDDERITHLLFLDSDMTFPAWAVMRFLQRDLPIVCGLYQRTSYPFNWHLIRKVPGKLDYIQLPYLRDYELGYPETMKDRLLKVDATGAGFLLCKREVFEKIREMNKPWFSTMMDRAGLDYCGEDVYFFQVVQEAGFEVFVDTSIECGHCSGKMMFPEVFRKREIMVGDGEGEGSVWKPKR